jgi:YegS/Rv2252/BmrU family lipid kinase
MSTGPAVRFIAHPGAGRGAFARRWPAVAAALAAHQVEHEVALTTREGEAAGLARRAADDGARLVVAVGGDGTLHEVVNGLLDGRTVLPAEMAVGLIAAGRGSDYARGLGLPADPEAIVSRFAAFLDGDPSATRPVDAAEVRYSATRLVAGREIDGGMGERAVRRYVNSAGIGFSPFVAQRTHRFPPRLGAYLYTVAGLVTIVDWHDRLVELAWDDGTREERAVESIELALGPYEGGGMLVAPDASPDDGLLDVVVIGAVSRLEMLTFAWRVRSGDHLRSPRVSVRRARRVGIEARDDRGPIYLQADGELLGRDPFEIEVLPAALHIVW